MKSLLKLKQSAVSLRKQGESYLSIQKRLDIPKSTLNYWLSKIPMSKQKRKRLNDNWKHALNEARKKAAMSHRLAKQNRINLISKEVKDFFKRVKFDNKTLELFLAGLYLGDGYKIEGRMALGSSNPQILLSFVTLLRKLYPIKESRLRAAIYARADHKEVELLNFWSKLLNIPIIQ